MPQNEIWLRDVLRNLSHTTNKKTQSIAPFAAQHVYSRG